ncbi:MAG: hypothetical protein K0S28_597 [Paucimonas sp.]|jgi:hypothetical protein|nr:hypothetical protein [Paucimonas sp.]
MKHIALQSMSRALDELRMGSQSISVFCTVWRTQKPALASLPTRYLEVMENLLVRLETGSMFTEESCSFSQEDLHQAFASWLRQATTLSE